MEARLREVLFKLRRALDPVLDRTVRRVEGGKSPVLGPAQNDFHLPKRRFKDGTAREPMRCQQTQRGRDSVFVPSDLLAQLLNDRARVQLSDFGSEGIAECVRGLDKLLELDTLLRTERRLPEQV